MHSLKLLQVDLKLSLDLCSALCVQFQVIKQNGRVQIGRVSKSFQSED